MDYRRAAVLVVVFVMVSSLALFLKPYIPGESRTQYSGEKILLPPPRLEGSMSVEEAIAKRRSIREYKDEPLSREELGQLLWACQGITHEEMRAAPSAGATYPFEIFVVVGRVDGLKPGIYHYDPFEHSLTLVKEGDFRRELQEAALNQEWVGKAAMDIVLVAFYERTTKYYGERGIRYVHMEAGHIGQNIYLQATALGLGTVAVGAFDDERVAEILGTKGAPLYIFPVGRA
ncbi:NAD(P)H-flavin oxidoreductase [Thermococcus kodakarensis KOD1]|uniref:NAD(P)H-flavin oxidoreductase n=1 Tax=Thermococcus kodakarensis (strain ATCC BAA-918 / JCM 12380 / KOD1) TaxID=69014 RepID=Q5JDF1_THEKO|nr:SagB/ThcOx family dehydrogenase [Thermococcus kodakarensis]WCN28846.1 SagB/ThcOx family dehydrogenase [Thermococcus kodakarensis]WCN31148.1 SagB/ThcOx family dehydrogenase [Thermococcus kodakarensis]BAD85029.1 NAD(P)H-flavin oxidoreductase [Thermococcus kodakarensis KOD1]